MTTDNRPTIMHPYSGEEFKVRRLDRHHLTVTDRVERTATIQYEHKEKGYYVHLVVDAWFKTLEEALEYACRNLIESRDMLGADDEIDRFFAGTQ